MTTRIELRQALRLRLEDDSPAPLWDDASLNAAIAAAVRAYGGVFPRQVTTGVTVPEAATRVSLSTEIAPGRVTRITDAAGIWAPPWSASAERPGARGQAWRIWGKDLLLAEPAAASGAGIWQIEHLAGREPPASDGDSLDILPGDEPILLCLAESSALARRAVEDAKRGMRSETGARAEAAQRQAERLLQRRKRRASGGRLSPA